MIGDGFCPHGVHHRAPCGQCTEDEFGPNNPWPQTPNPPEAPLDYGWEAAWAWESGWTAGYKAARANPQVSEGAE